MNILALSFILNQVETVQTNSSFLRCTQFRVSLKEGAHE